MRLYNVKKEKPIKIRRHWRINPKSKIKESAKIYNRKKLKNNNGEKNDYEDC